MEDVKLSGETKCKICGKSDFVTVGEMTDHMLKHEEFVEGINKVLPGFSDKIKKRRNLT